MRAQGKRCRVVGQYKHSVLLSYFIQIIANISNNFFVDKLNGANLVFDFRTVAALVGRLKVNVNKVCAVFERVKSGICLALEIRVDISRRAVNVYRLKTCTDCNSLYKVNRGNNRAVKTVKLFKAFKPRLSALAPNPD